MEAGIGISNHEKHDDSGIAVSLSFNANMFPWVRLAKVTNFDDTGRILFATHGFGVDGGAYADRFSEMRFAVTMECFEKGRGIGGGALCHVRKFQQQASL